MYRGEGLPPGFLRALKIPLCMEHSLYLGIRSLKGAHGSAGEDAMVLQRLGNAAQEPLLCRRPEGSSWQSRSPSAHRCKVTD